MVHLGYLVIQELGMHDRAVLLLLLCSNAHNFNRMKTPEHANNVITIQFTNMYFHRARQSLHVLKL